MGRKRKQSDDSSSDSEQEIQINIRDDRPKRKRRKPVRFRIDSSTEDSETENEGNDDQNGLEREKNTDVQIEKERERKEDGYTEDHIIYGLHLKECSEKTWSEIEDECGVPVSVLQKSMASEMPSEEDRSEVDTSSGDSESSSCEISSSEDTGQETEEETEGGFLDMEAKETESDTEGDTEEERDEDVSESQSDEKEIHDNAGNETAEKTEDSDKGKECTQDEQQMEEDKRSDRDEPCFEIKLSVDLDGEESESDMIKQKKHENENKCNKEINIGDGKVGNQEENMEVDRHTENEKMEICHERESQKDVKGDDKNDDEGDFDEIMEMLVEDGEWSDEDESQEKDDQSTIESHEEVNEGKPQEKDDNLTIESDEEVDELIRKFDDQALKEEKVEDIMVTGKHGAEKGENITVTDVKHDDLKQGEREVKERKTDGKGNNKEKEELSKFMNRCRLNEHSLYLKMSEMHNFGKEQEKLIMERKTLDISRERYEERFEAMKKCNNVNGCYAINQCLTRTRHRLNCIEQRISYLVAKEKDTIKKIEEMTKDYVCNINGKHELMM